MALNWDTAMQAAVDMGKGIGDGVLEVTGNYCKSVRNEPMDGQNNNKVQKSSGGKDNRTTMGMRMVRKSKDPGEQQSGVEFVLDDGLNQAEVVVMELTDSPAQLTVGTCFSGTIRG